MATKEKSSKGKRRRWVSEQVENQRAGPGEIVFRPKAAGLEIGGIAGAEWGRSGQTRETTHPAPLQLFYRMLSLHSEAPVSPHSADLGL